MFAMQRYGVWAIAAVLIATMFGVVTARNPSLGVALTGISLLLTMVYCFGVHRDRIVAWSLCSLLLGYLILGKGFAYLGVSPFYIGEATMIVVLLAMMTLGGLTLVFRSPITWILLVFASWGLVCTVPYFSTYQFDSLRDSVIWAYGSFAIVTAAFLLKDGRLNSVPELYGRCMPYILILLPAIFLLQYVAHDHLPVLSVGQTIPDIKTGDTGVHLAGAVSFLLLGLHRSPRKDRLSDRLRYESIWWILILIGIALVSAKNRGGMLAFATAAAVAFLVRPIRNISKIHLTGALLCLGLLFNLSFNISDGRQFSLTQITSNATSILGHSDETTDLAATREWRLEWWNKIIDYTIRGPYFWTGKGYGINLADDDGFQVDPEGSALRSPHNGHLTILARSGVPGFALWIVLQVTFFTNILWAFVRARRANQEWWARVNVWILCYWAAFLIDASFDVFLEGPQGGIWFWCWFGFGIAAIEYQRRSINPQAARKGGMLTPTWITKKSGIR